jgi:hypothetical protein
MMPSGLNLLRGKLVAVVLVPLICCGPAYGMAPEAVFNWVCEELQIQPAVQMPVVLFVDRATLAQVFRQNNQKARRLWQARYGSAQAERILRQCLDEVIGLFEPKNQIVYVADFLPDCRKEAILAHELTHYLQYATRDRADRDLYEEQTQHLFRELQAHRVAYRYMEVFCQTGEHP